ncbi:hypothetical protein [Micromonospora sp. NPDC047527]|uniref:hypothetical protein n=1 Tax=Micromonospora sp. NPDC047527 TaxID=3155144 RepID=UPI0033D22A15
MNLRTLVILAVSVGAGIGLGSVTSVEVGFSGALGIATLLHALVEPKTVENPDTPDRVASSRLTDR